MSKRNIGGSILPSNDARILTPIGPYRVRVIERDDTHGLFSLEADELLAEHPNGYSCYSLAERLLASKGAREQAEYIVRCGGTVTPAGWAAIAAGE